MNSRLSSISKVGAGISDPGDEFCLEVLAALRVQQVFAPLQTNLAENVKARVATQFREISRARSTGR